MILRGEKKRRLQEGKSQKKEGLSALKIVILSPSRFYSCSICTSDNEISLYKA